MLASICAGLLIVASFVVPVGGVSALRVTPQDPQDSGCNCDAWHLPIIASCGQHSGGWNISLIVDVTQAAANGICDFTNEPECDVDLDCLIDYSVKIRVPVTTHIQSGGNNLGRQHTFDLDVNKCGGIDDVDFTVEETGVGTLCSRTALVYCKWCTLP